MKKTFINILQEICATPDGLTTSQIQDKTGKDAKSFSPMLARFLKRGWMFKAGIPLNYRYFTNADHAQAFELIAHQVDRDDRAAAKERGLALKRARWARLTPEKKAQYRNQPVPEPRMKVVQSKPVPKAEKKFVSITIAKKKETFSVAKAAVEWPKHIKVQVCPSADDMRFKFSPPDGWQGEFVREWQNLRKA